VKNYSIIATLLFLVNIGNLFAQTSPIKKKKKIKKEEKAVEKKVEVPKKNMVDHIHKVLSRDILSVANRLDNFFGTERADDEANTTRIRIYTETTKLEAQNPTTQGNIKLQLVLPKTQERLKLVVDTQNDRNDDASSTQATSANTTTTTTTPTKTKEKSTTQRTADATTAALRYIVDTAGIKTSFDAGLRFTTKPQLFSRVRFRKYVPLGPKWVFRPVEQIMWIQDQGFTSDTDLDFDRPINKKWQFRFQNNIYWNDDDYSLAFTNGPSWLQTLDEKKALSYNFRISSANSPEYAVNNYALSVGFRQLLYKEWFFWTITPAVNFPRDNSFHRTPSLTVRFDVIVGSI
jgi:hypothetical protein